MQVTFAFHRNTSRKTAKEVKQIAFVESDISHNINEDTERRFLWARYMRCGPVSRQHGLERGGVDRTARARDSLETNPVPPPLPHRA